MCVGQQSSSVASVSGVGEGEEGSVLVGQQSSSVVSGVGEGGKGSVEIEQRDIDLEEDKSDSVLLE